RYLRLHEEARSLSGSIRPRQEIRDVHAVVTWQNRLHGASDVEELPTDQEVIGRIQRLRGDAEVGTRARERWQRLSVVIEEKASHAVQRNEFDDHVVGWRGRLDGLGL